MELTQLPLSPKVQWDSLSNYFPLGTARWAPIFATHPLVPGEIYMPQDWYRVTNVPFLKPKESRWCHLISLLSLGDMAEWMLLNGSSGSWDFLLMSTAHSPATLLSIVASRIVLLDLERALKMTSSLVILETLARKLIKAKRLPWTISGINLTGSGSRVIIQSTNQLRMKHPWVESLFWLHLSP